MGLHLSPNDSDESEPTSSGSMPEREEKLLVLGRLAEASNYANDCGRTVSYTHLTLPTICSV